MDWKSAFKIQFWFIILMCVISASDGRRPERNRGTNCTGRNAHKLARCQNRNEDLRCGDHNLASGGEAVISSTSVKKQRRNRRNCKWRIKTEDEHNLRVDCDVLHRGSKTCRSSHLTVTDTIDRTSKLCGTRTSVGMISNTGVVEIISNSINSRSFRKFNYRCTIKSYKKLSSTLTTTKQASPASSPKCKCGRTNRRRRIVGGSQVEPNEYPWQVALVRANSTRPFCGGSIISDSWILTAAHCLDNKKPEKIRVVVGEHDWSTLLETKVTRRLKVKYITIHYGFAINGLIDHDIGLVQLEEPIMFPEDNTIAPVCLPRPHRDYPEADALVVGWGTTEDKLSGPSKYLRVADVRTMTNGVCQKLVAMKGIVMPNMICAGYLFSGESACHGDSGGPLLIPGEGCGGRCLVNIGIVSWGAFCNAGVFPSVYTRTNRYLDWINIFIDGSNTCEKSA